MTKNNIYTPHASLIRLKLLQNEITRNSKSNVIVLIPGVDSRNNKLSQVSKVINILFEI